MKRRWRVGRRSVQNLAGRHCCPTPLLPRVCAPKDEPDGILAHHRQGFPGALVTERPVALPPVWLEEGSMSKTNEYRQFANDCIVWARIATSDDQREQFLELAKKWMSDAESIDQGIELRPSE